MFSIWIRFLNSNYAFVFPFSIIYNTQGSAHDSAHYTHDSASHLSSFTWMTLNWTDRCINWCTPITSTNSKLWLTFVKMNKKSEIYWLLIYTFCGRLHHITDIDREVMPSVKCKDQVDYIPVLWPLYKIHEIEYCTE